MTKDEFLEYIRCRDDIVYFINRYINNSITNNDKEFLTINFIKNTSTLNITNSVDSLICLTYIAIHRIIFSNNSNIIIISNFNSKRRKELIKTIKTLICKLPKLFQIKIANRFIYSVYGFECNTNSILFVPVHKVRELLQGRTITTLLMNIIPQYCGNEFLYDSVINNNYFVNNVISSDTSNLELFKKEKYVLNINN